MLPRLSRLAALPALAALTATLAGSTAALIRSDLTSTLASRLARLAGLAAGRELEAAVEAGLEFVHRAIAAAPGLGRGHGPLNHGVRPPETEAPR